MKVPRITQLCSKQTVSAVYSNADRFLLLIKLTEEIRLLKILV